MKAFFDSGGHEAVNRRKASGDVGGFHCKRQIEMTSIKGRMRLPIESLRRHSAAAARKITTFLGI